MKVTRGYIRKLVLEAMDEMNNEPNFDFNFTLGQILQVAQDNNIKIKGSDGFPIKDGEKPTKGSILASTNGFPVYYTLKISFDVSLEEISYKFFRVEAPNNVNNLKQKKVDDYEIDVKSYEDVEGLNGVIYAFGRKDFKYLEELAQVLSKDNESRTQ